MLRFAVLLAMFIGISSHAHWDQPPNPIVEPIICPGHPGTYAMIFLEAKSIIIAIFQNNQQMKTIRKNYLVTNFQFSAGCARFMMDSERGRESISLFDDA